MVSVTPSPFQFTEIKKVLLLLDRKDRFRLFLVLIVNTMLAFLDLVGVALIGVASAILIRGLQDQQAGDQVSRFLGLLNLDGLPQQTLLILLGATAVFFFVLKTILSVYFLRRILRYLSIRNAQISSSLVSKMLNQPVEKISSKSIQHQIYNVTGGVEKLVGSVVTSLVVVASDLVLLLVILTGLMLVDPITSIGTFFVFTGIAFLLYFLLHKRVAILNSKFAYQSIYFNQKVSEGINSFRDLFIKGGREFYVNEMRKSKMQIAGYDAEIKFIPNISKYTIEISVILGIALIAGIQFYLFDSNRAIAVISVFLAASTRIAPAVIRLQQNIIQVKSGLAGAQPTFDLIEDLKGVKELGRVETLISTNHTDFSPRVKLSNLKFAYSEAADETIKDISLEVSEGKFIAFVGPSGGGKSTLIDLTVKENICLGFNPDSVPDELVWQALQLADLSEFVKGLEGQLSYRISDAGKNLSGGQRQRLGIARALLTKPKIVIFDEATSALDAETENRVSESILKLTGECTVIFIAHRLSVVRSADMIYYIDKGKIVSQGSFEELRKLNADFNNQANFMGI